MGADIPPDLLSARLLVVLRLLVGLGLALPLLREGPYTTLSAVMVLGGLGSAVLIRGWGGEPGRLGVLVADLALLTALLWTWPGDGSAWTPLYAFPVLMGALTLPSGLAWGVFAAAVSGYVALQQFGPPPPHHHAPEAMRVHLWGMFASTVGVSGLTVFAAGRVRQAQAQAAAGLEQARASQARAERLSALATLAAGAAHELATPLSTILLVSRELGRQSADPAAREDLALIGDEVGRCQEVLTQLTADAGAGMGEAPARVALPALLAGALGEAPGLRVEAEPVVVEVPARLVGQALRRLVGNAQQAAPPPAEVVVRAGVHGGRLRLSVRDPGPGMAPEVLARAGEPFYTTRAQGRGLGLYFVRAVAERLGGRLELRSAPGQGTEAVLELPAVPA